MPETTFHTTFSTSHFLLSRAKNGSESGLRSAVSYRFGFNGKENDNEVKGIGNSVDFGARIYDSRLGRWLSVDPQFQSQPGWSPYKAFLDNPVIFVDPGGETEVVTVIVNDQRTGKTTTMSIIKSGDVMTDGVRHPVTSWYDVCGYHYETKYYDFETIYTINIAPDGKVTSSSTIDIKNTSKSKCTVFGLRAPYDRKQTELEVQGGIMFTSSVFKGGTNWVVKKKSAAVNIEDIDALLGMISAAGLDKGTALKSLTETVEYISDSFEAGQDIVEVVQEAVEMFSPAEPIKQQNINDNVNVGIYNSRTGFGYNMTTTKSDSAKDVDAELSKDKDNQINPTTK